jgi:uncharacterized integral membrane protein
MIRLIVVGILIALWLLILTVRNLNKRIQNMEREKDCIK